MDLYKLTSEVRDIAIKAGHYLKEERKKFDRKRIIEKNAHDYVSYVDQETEKLLVDELSRILPSAGFIGEEGVRTYNNEEYCWVIDPLDGTTNFIHDNSPYCVSIALKKDNDILIGVVYEVCRNECFYAYKGGGAYLDGEKIQVSEVNTLDECLLGLDLPYNAIYYKPVIADLMQDMYGKASSIRINGSAATSLCYVACGRYDLWLEAYIKCWDYSAGMLIVEEAGGAISNFGGDKLEWGEHHVIASNGHLDDYVLGLLQPYFSKL